MTEYEQANKYILSIPKFTTKNSPADTRVFYERLGLPGESKKIIHVAGTNGKGSVCAFLECILRKAGKHTVLFTSPHLVDIGERFRIDGVIISEENFLKGYHKVKKVCEETVQEGKPHPTFFEFLFFIAMELFASSEAEYIILETGLGGRLDATNTVKNKLLTVITSIGLDHTEYLGDTLEKIAAEKAGILRPGVPVVFSDVSTEVTKVITEKAKELCCESIPVSNADINFLKFHHKTIDFSYQSRYDRYIRLSIPFAAEYQMQNAAIAIACIEKLNSLFPQYEQVRKQDIITGLRETKWAGRMEEVQPDIYIDGAHNQAGILAFVENINRHFKNKKKVLLFSAVADKDSAVMIQTLSDIQFDEIIVTKLLSDRGERAEALGELFGKYTDVPVTVTIDAQEAFSYAVKRKALIADNAVLFAVGSLYLAGEIYSLLQRKGGRIID